MGGGAAAEQVTMGGAITATQVTMSGRTAAGGACVVAGEDIGAPAGAFGDQESPPPPPQVGGPGSVPVAAAGGEGEVVDLVDDLALAGSLLEPAVRPSRPRSAAWS